MRLLRSTPGFAPSPVRRGAGLAVAVTGAVALSAGPAGAWAVAGVGLCVTLLGQAAVIVWQRRRSVVRP